MTYITLHNELASLEDIQTWLKLLFMKYSILWAEIMNIKGQTETIYFLHILWNNIRQGQQLEIS